MAKKKVHAEEHPDETWLIPYADILTLLLALFIVMFAMSKVNQEKFEEVSQAFSIIFKGGSGVLGNGNVVVVHDGSGASTTSDGSYQYNFNFPDSSEASSSTDSSATVSALDSPVITNITIEKGIYNYSTEDIRMNEIKDQLEREIATSGYNGKIAVTLTPVGLVISLQEVVLFESGDAEVAASVYPMLNEIAKMLKGLENQIKVEGHTDNVPICNSKYRSNWDLSAYRAINVMNYVVNAGNLNPARFYTVGYGEYSPKYDNTTDEGRAMNRRVEIFVIRKYPLSSESSATSK